MLGAELVAKSPADGYTLLYCGWPTIGSNQVVYKDLRYKLEGFIPITTIFHSPVGLTVRKDFPANSLKERFDFVPKNGGLGFGTSGAGSSPHLLLMRIRQVVGLPLEHVPYKGESPAVLDVLGGHLPLFAGSVATPAQHLRSGALKLIATSAEERLPAFADAQTVKDAGLPEQTFSYWHGFAAPVGTPKLIIDKLHAAIAAAMSSPAVRSVLGPDQIAATMAPEAFGALIRKDMAAWAPLIRSNNLKPIVMGHDPLRREDLHRRMWGRVRAATVRMIGAINVALWDIAGQAANLPIHALIGTYRDSLPVYASSPAYDRIKDYIEEAQHWRACAMPAYKIHAPAPWKHDIANCEAVRHALGDDPVLMLGARWTYDYPSALRLGRALKALTFHWFQDPMGEWRIPNCVKLRQKLDISLMATELPFAGFDTCAPWLMAQATDFLRGDVAFKGGITNLIKTAHLAEAFGINYKTPRHRGRRDPQVAR